MTTDLDRLHEVATMHNIPRRAGKTTLDCHLVAGAIAVGERSILVMLPRWDHLQHVVPLLLRVLEEHGLTAGQMGPRAWEVCGGPDGPARITFLSQPRWGNELLGREGHLVDFG